MAGPLFPFLVRREGYAGLDLLEFEERKGFLPELAGRVGELQARVSEGKKEVRKIVP